MLIINRKKEFFDLLYPYKIFIDGKEIDKIYNGEIKNLS